MNKAVILDIFGVLYPDTFWGLADKYVPERSRELQTQLHDLVSRVDKGQIGRVHFWKEASELYGVEKEQVMKDIDNLGGVDKTLLAYVSELKNRGYKTGIISNIGQGFIDGVVTPKQQKELFDAIILSSEVGYLKPSPEIFRIAAERLNLNPANCLFFDDVERNVLAARETGLKSEVYIGINECKRVTEEFLKVTDSDK